MVFSEEIRQGGLLAKDSFNHIVRNALQQHTTPGPHTITTHNFVAVGARRCPGHTSHTSFDLSLVTPLARQLDKVRNVRGYEAVFARPDIVSIAWKTIEASSMGATAHQVHPRMAMVTPHALIGAGPTRCYYRHLHWDAIAATLGIIRTLG